MIYALVGLFISALLLWLALRGVDFHAVLDTLSSANLAFVWPSMFLLVAFYSLKLERWRWLLASAVRPARSQLLQPMMIGFAANNVLPLRAGEVIRVLLAGRTLGLPKTQILATVVVERLFDFLSIAVIVIAGLVFLAIDERHSGNAVSLLIAALVTAVVSTLTIVLLPWLAKRMVSRPPAILPAKLRASLVSLGAHFSAGLQALTSRRQQVLIAGNSLLQWILMTAIVYCAIASMATQLPEFTAATCVLGFVVLGITLPSSPGFIGAIEFAFVFGLSLFGFAPEQALAMAVFYHVVTFSFVVLIGGVCLLAYRYRGRQSC